MKIILLFLLFFHSINAEELKGKVIGVMDGDTIKLLTEEKESIKIRLLYIDAPEKKQSYGQESKKALSNLIFGKEIIVSSTGKDRYGRTLGEIFLDSENINLAMVKNGHAWHYKEYSKGEKYSQYAEAESQARDEKLGLWKNENPVYPSDWRKEEKGTKRNKPFSKYFKKFHFFK